MRKIILIYGSIAGAIAGGMLLITMPLYEKGILKMNNGEWLGYTTMVVALSLIFFGIKAYRDRELGGVISFGKALKLGILIALVASLIYAISWEATYQTMSGDFLSMMNEQKILKMKKEGATESTIQDANAEMERFAAIYKNPFIRFGITLFEILPLGIIISLFCALLLKRKESFTD